MSFAKTSWVNPQGHLLIGGCDTVELAVQFGTPLYVYDEACIRQNIHRFVTAFCASGCSFQIAYASKAFSCIAMMELAAAEHLCLDVASGGELYTALQAGFPTERIHFHGNNKSEAELQMALDANIGCFIIDNFQEMEHLHELVSSRKQQINVMVRLRPAIQVETHQYIATGQEDSKFGLGIRDGQAMEAMEAMEAMRFLLKQPFFRLLGVHVHLGSQIFSTDGFVHAIHVIRQFLDQVHCEMAYEVQVLNVGGGFGIRYTAEDHPASIEQFVNSITAEVKQLWQQRGLPTPEIWIEPGRSITGNAGTTLYTIGSIKPIPGIRTYVAIDGGMADNLRPVLYQAKYEAILANKANLAPSETVTIAGKCCESGDVLIWNIPLPKVSSGDLLAVLSTGAYGYSMASNYNRLPRPAVVFVQNGVPQLVIERETYEDLVRKDRTR
jgi:diaminopimelate decarboxylase